MKTSRILLVLILIVFSAVVWRLVSYNLARQQPPSDVPVIAATTFPLADILRNLAGDALTVEQLIPTGTDPHTFEPTPSIAESVMRADVVYAIGYDYDSWVTEFVDADTDVANLAGEIAERRTGDADTAIYIDPHYWLSAPNVQSMARLAARDLSSRFPVHKAAIQANLTTYLALLETVDADIRATLDAATQKQIVTQHDAWYYFANEYGLTSLGTFEETAEEEPSARHLIALADAMRAASVHTIYAHAGETSEALRQFAEDNSFTLLTVDPEGLGGADSLIELLRSNAQAFAQNQ